MDNNVNNISNLSIFEDYEFNINSQTNTANLIIRFIEILHAEYQIEFSFKDLTLSPTQAPTITSNNPSKSPTLFPTKSPSKSPTLFPTKTPSKTPSKSPTLFPTKSPSKSPTLFPTKTPSKTPSKSPTLFPTKSPSKSPTLFPTKSPSYTPTKTPTYSPSYFPTKFPTKNPTITPTQQTMNPTINPTQTPTQQTQIPSTNPTNMPTINDLLSTDVFESINEQNEITIFKGMTMSYSVMLGLFIGIGIIILMTMFVCILLCCVILRQKRKYKEKVGEIERIQSVPTLSPGFIPTITKLGSFGSIKDVPPIPIQAIPSNENHYETNQIQIEMSPKSVSN
eukprot:725680_1